MSGNAVCTAALHLNRMASFLKSAVLIEMAYRNELDVKDLQKYELDNKDMARTGSCSQGKMV